MVKSGIGGIAKKSRSVLGSDCGADPEVSALAVARACSSSSAIVRLDEGVDDEKYVLRTAEEALKITEAKRKEIKERQEEARRKKLAEFPNSDEFKRLMRCINTRISFGDDHKDK